MVRARRGGAGEGLMAVHALSRSRWLGLALSVAIVMVASVAVWVSGLTTSNPVLASVRNRIDPVPGGAFVNESVSFRSSSGRQASHRAVPVGHAWRLQTLRAVNCEDGARPMEFLLADADGTVQAVLSTVSAGPVLVSAGGTLVWNGSVIVPGGWRVYARWHDMAGGFAACNWQYTAIEVSS